MNAFLQSLFIRVFRVFLKPKGGSASCDGGNLAAEQLEPRILYSAAPVEAPAAAEEATAQEASAAAAEPVPIAEAPVAVPVKAGEVDLQDGDVPPTQGVELVDVDSEAAALNQETVETLAAEARQRWIDSGISAEQIAALDSVSYDIADVGGAHLGVANGFSITIDDDAGGTGVGNWFIDATPGDDVEFGSNVSVAASGRFDLLSTLIHEQGHVLGLSDLYGARTDVMDGFLDAGTRRLPAEGQAQGAIVGAIAGDNFLTANIVRVSTDSNGAEATGGSSYNSEISGNGRYAAFSSDADNLVVGDTNGERDVFVKDLVTGDVTRVSTDSAGNETTAGGSFSPSISDDGRYVAFHSEASNLVADDTNFRRDIFVKDLQTGVTTRVNTDSAGAQALGGHSGGVAISADGRYVVFDSAATNLIEEDNNAKGDIFRKDLMSGEIRRVNESSSGVEATGTNAIGAEFSADGRFVIFQTSAGNLVPGDNNIATDVFRKDMKTDKLRRVSTNSAGKESVGGFTGNASISANGRYVAFGSLAGDLVDDDTNGVFDVFVKDLKTGKTTRVSTDSDGAQGSHISQSFDSAISADGRFVVFTSDSSNLVVGDDNGVADVFVKDRKTGVTTRVSTDSGGAQGSGGTSGGAAISADGRFMAFTSGADNLVAGDSNGLFDVFAKAISSINPYTTSVHVDGSGNLIIEDIEGGDSKDNLFLEMKDGRLEISDKKNTVGSDIFGSMAVGTKGRAVSIDPDSFTGDIIVRTLGGDDVVTLGDLSGLPGGVEVEDGDGHDVVRQAGEVVLTGAASVDYRSEQIRLEKRSSISVADGKIELRGNSGETSIKRSIGVFANRSSLLVHGDGNVIITGVGGAVGTGNRGVDLRNTTLTTGGGIVRITGTGGDGVSGNEGVRIGKGTRVLVMGSGDLKIVGAGVGTGNNNRGVFIQSNVELRVGGGQLFIFGNSLSGKSGNTGVLIQKAGLFTSGAENLRIVGDGGGTGANNAGVILRGTTLRATSFGDVLVSGEGSSIANGSANRGVDFRSANIVADGGGDVMLSGSGGGGASSNSGLRAVATIVSSTDGAVSISGDTQVPDGRNANRGVNFSKGSISAGGTLTINGLASRGVNLNEGIRLVSAQLTAAGGITVSGSASLSTGSSNRGIFAKNVEVTGSTVTVVGNSPGSNVVNNNEALRLLTSNLSADGPVSLQANGAASATGSGNRGAFLSKVTVESLTSVGIHATAGSGTHSNAGLYINASSISTNGSGVTVSGSKSSGVTTGANNYGILVKNSVVSSSGSVSLLGTASSGSHGNSGLTIINGSMQAAGANLSLSGFAEDSTTGSRNYGVKVTRATLSSVNNLSIDGEGGGGVSGNFGVHLSRTRAVADNRIMLTGAVGATTTGKDNRGVFLHQSTVDALSSTRIEGTGGMGGSKNEGVRIVGGEINSGTGSLEIAGTASAFTSGKNNSGVFIFNGVSMHGTSIDIDGTGGGGTGKDFGVYMHRNISASGASVNGMATDGVSEDEAGDFFDP